MQRPLLPIFITAALVFAGYAAFVQVAPFIVPTGQNQGDTNMIRAQDYLAAQDRAATVLVGSSLTFRLPAAELGPQTVNLAFAGGGALTGLEIVEESGGRPKLVLVETNVLTRGLDRDFVRSLLRFPERQMRRHLRVFQTGYDPANLAQRGMARFLNKADYMPVPPPQVVRQLTVVQQEDMSKSQDLALMRANLSATATAIAQLQSRGIRVGFFEMPTDPSLKNLPGETIPRREAAAAFPDGRFCWLHLEVSGGAHTLDGIHLAPDDAALVARKIRAQQDACL
jgi:hypothetical protein